jgi:hypothetical protein
MVLGLSGQGGRNGGQDTNKTRTGNDQDSEGGVKTASYDGTYGPNRAKPIRRSHGLFLDYFWIVFTEISTIPAAEPGLVYVRFLQIIDNDIDPGRRGYACAEQIMQPAISRR